MNLNNIELSKDGSNYIAVFSNKAYIINSHFYSILLDVQLGKTIEESIRSVSIQTGIEYTILYNKFEAFIRATQNMSTKDSYIWYKCIIIKDSVINKMAAPLSILFHKQIFIVIAVISVMINLSFVFTNYKQQIVLGEKTAELYFSIFIGYLLSLIIHEIGHATAMSTLKQRAKEIGFGFYMIFPVFYTDVTSIWSMGKKERMMVSIGGVYFQLIINTFIIGIIYTCNQFAYCNALKYIVLANIFVITMSLTPFLRNDGYWILADFWDVPNLQKRSDQEVFKLFYKTSIHNRKPSAKLLIFGIANNTFRFYVLYSLIWNIVKIIKSTHFMMSWTDMIEITINVTLSVIGVLWILNSIYKMYKNNYG